MCITNSQNWSINCNDSLFLSSSQRIGCVHHKTERETFPLSPTLIFLSLSLRCKPNHQGESGEAAAAQQEAGPTDEARLPRWANEGQVHSEHRHMKQSGNWLLIIVL